MAITRITQKTTLIHADLEEAAKRLARLGGTDRAAAAARRRSSTATKRRSRSA